MEEQQKNIDDLFRQSLSDYREAPPAAAWDRLAAQLGADGIEPKNKYFFTRWLWFSLVFILLVGGGWFIAAYQSHNKTIATQHSLQENRNQDGIAENAGTNNDISAKKADTVSHSLNKKSISQKSLQQSMKGIASSRSRGGFTPSENAPKTRTPKGSSLGKNDEGDQSQNQVGNRIDEANSDANTASIVGRTSTKSLAGGKAKTGQIASQNIVNNSPKSNLNSSTSSTKRNKKSYQNKSAETQAEQASRNNSTATGNGRNAKNSNSPNSGSNKNSVATTKSKISSEKREEIAKNVRPKAATKKLVLPKEKQAIAAKLPKGKTQANRDKSKLAKEGKKALAKELGKPTKGKVASANSATTNTKPEEAIAKKLPPLVRQTEFKWQPMAKAEPATTNENEDAPHNDTEDDEQEPITLATGSGTSGGGGAGSGVEEKKKNHKPQSFSVAAMAGYELPTKKSGVNQISAGLSLLWHFDPGIALGIQPMFRFGNLSSRGAGDPTAYQQSSYQVDSVIRVDSFGKVGYRQYSISQKFDSISVAGAAISGTMWQIELPIILSYKIAKAWRLYLGASLNLGGKLNATSGSVQHFESTRSDTLGGVGGGSVLPARSAASFANYFGESSLPQFSQYRPAAVSVEQPASLRFGYLFGVGYDAKRFTFDASIHQQVSGYEKLPKSVQDVFSAAAIRLSFGYYLVPPRNKRISTEP
ncbi:MAG: hypothetical protein ABI378_06730 [Chitinophagaceae bacterium]